MGEFNDMFEGYKYRDDKTWEKVAQLASWFIATQQNNPPTALKLLGREVKNATTAEETKGVLLDLTKRLGKGLVS